MKGKSGFLTFQFFLIHVSISHQTYQLHWASNFRYRITNWSVKSIDKNPRIFLQHAERKAGRKWISGRLLNRHNDYWWSIDFGKYFLMDRMDFYFLILMNFLGFLIPGNFEPLPKICWWNCWIFFWYHSMDLDEFYAWQNEICEKTRCIDLWNQFQ